ncbi:MAG TPA: triose-phosphate isomerase [Nitrospirae bacterium]|nr:triosephosphate isomerase [bacterium BMS3Abin06]HDH13615.1 triose-phosphate isomerase [Nitrospirota bacterium]HDZ00929.1 triose-phosphate isomerase [Nitrospirota bacterium]
MRKPYIAANWKMNKTIEETGEFINAFLPMVRDITDVDILIAPPFTSLAAASRLLKSSNVILGAQNVYYEEKGAYTGEISPGMLLSAGCSCVIIGHSERRQYFSETDEIVNKKIKTARNNNLEVILCIGESLDEREANRTFEVLDRQLAGSLRDLSLDGITIAYEPIWAIGTGKTASKEQANEAHTYIREWLRKNKDGADIVRIQYGGSVKPDNIESLMSEPEVDGALVGGASLKPDSFAGIVTGAIKK